MTKSLTRFSDLEFHVSGSRSLRSGSRDLLRQVGSRHDLLSQGDAVVLEEDHLEFVADISVTVDDVAHVVEQLDDLLGHEVAGGRLSAWN